MSPFVFVHTGVCSLKEVARKCAAKLCGVAAWFAAIADGLHVAAMMSADLLECRCCEDLGKHQKE